MTQPRFPLLLTAITMLLVAIWAGLLRLGWEWPSLRPNWSNIHGPLMVTGFLGTPISLERAIAYQHRLAYLPTLLMGLGGAILLAGIPGQIGFTLAATCLTLGSSGLAILLTHMGWGHRALHTAVLSLAAWCFFIGNLLWLIGWPVAWVVPWWLAFLILPIAGERLELNRVQRLTTAVPHLFAGASAIFLLGVIWSATLSYPTGFRLSGLGMILLSAWLIRYDLARRNLRRQGLIRFIAICLYSGYIWLGIGGLLTLWHGGVIALHATFLGFVFAMIFGHAPLIFPAILGHPLPYRPWAYLPLLLLHTSLLLRLTADLLLWTAGRQWGGLLNGLALLTFLGNTAVSLQQQPN